MVAMQAAAAIQKSKRNKPEEQLVMLVEEMKNMSEQLLCKLTLQPLSLWRGRI